MVRLCGILSALGAMVLASPGCLPAGCRGGDEATLTLGTGVDAYQPLPTPPTLDLIYGPQGGVHLDVSLRASGLDLSALWDVEIRGLIGGVVRADTRPQVEATCDEDLALSELVGMRLILHGDVRPVDLMDGIDVTARVTDGRDVTVEATVEDVTIVFP